MPFTLSNTYCTVQDVKDALRIQGSDITDDNRITLAINAATRQIENYTERRFWQDTVATARHYTATTPFLVEVDDFQTTAGLIVQTDPYGDGTFPVTWASTDYQLEPLNAQYDGQPWVYDKLRAIRSLLFPVYGGIAYPQPYTQGLVQVTAQWGWNAIPADVIKATILQAIALFKADDTPFGATPFGETGIVRLRGDLHPTAAALLGPYMSQGVLVG